jgi:DNA-binding transcriptional LysR family regulator
MHRRYDHANIPIEVLRTFIAVNDAAGNFSKTALALGLTQPAVSAQMKRLQQVIGKPLLQKTATGVRLTDDGTVVLLHARRIVAMNDQLLSHSRPSLQPDQLRIGMPRWVRKTNLIEIVKKSFAAHPNGRVSFRCDNLEHLTHDLYAGLLDIALLCNVSTPPGPIFDEWWEQLYWVKSPHLVLKPGVPIPLISWAG